MVTDGDGSRPRPGDGHGALRQPGAAPADGEAAGGGAANDPPPAAGEGLSHSDHAASADPFGAAPACQRIAARATRLPKRRAVSRSPSDCEASGAALSDWPPRPMKWPERLTVSRSALGGGDARRRLARVDPVHAVLGGQDRPGSAGRSACRPRSECELVKPAASLSFQAAGEEHLGRGVGEGSEGGGDVAHVGRGAEDHRVGGGDRVDDRVEVLRRRSRSARARRSTPAERTPSAMFLATSAVWP